MHARHLSCDTKGHAGMCDLSLIPPLLRSPPAAGTQSVALLLLLGSYSSSGFIFCQNQNMQDPQVLLTCIKKKNVLLWKWFTLIRKIKDVLRDSTWPGARHSGREHSWKRRGRRLQARDGRELSRAHVDCTLAESVHKETVWSQFLPKGCRSPQSSNKVNVEKRGKNMGVYGVSEFLKLISLR